MSFLGYRAFLDAQGARLYDELRAGLSTRKARFSAKKVDKALFGQVIEMVRLDLPEIYEVGTVAYEFSTMNPLMTIIPNYHPCDDSVERAALATERRKIVSRITERTDWEKMLKLHDVICRNIVYQDIGPEAHSIVGPLLRRKAVCEGISKMVKYVCDALNIPCYVVTGQASSSTGGLGKGPHAWNKVLLLGRWVNVDVTFDLSISTKENIRHDYFAIPDEVISHDHAEDRQTKPCMARDIDFFTRKGLVMKDLAALFDKACRHLRLEGDVSFEFRFPYDTKGVDSSNVMDTLQRAHEACRRSGTISVSSGSEVSAYFIAFNCCVR